MRSVSQFLILTVAVLFAGGCSNKAKQTPPPEVGDRAAQPAEPDPEPVAEPEVPEAEADELSSDERELGIPAICSALGDGEVDLSNVNFGFNEYDLTEETRATLDAHAACLRAMPGLELVLEGHCDERGTQEFNLALGNDRAHAVRRYLGNLGIAGDRLRPVTKGKNQPLCDEGSEDCWARNRRVKFVPVSAEELARIRF